MKGREEAAYDIPLGLISIIFSVLQFCRNLDGQSSGSEIKNDRENYVPRLRSDGDQGQLLKKTLELVQVRNALASGRRKCA